MPIKKIAAIMVMVCAGLPLSLAQEKRGPDRSARNIDQWSDAEVESWMRSRLDRGLMLGDDMAIASHARSAIVVPLAERKIEEVLKSSSPAACFTDPKVDPQEFVRDAVSLICGAGDENALKAASSLMKIDEARFGWIVGNILFNGMGYRNPFTVAYGGLAIGDSSIDKRVVQWVDQQLSQGAKSTRQAWADAMLDKYSVVPNEAQWASDPIASRLSPKVGVLVRDDVTRLAAETLQKRIKR